jgi:DNA-binding NarL/FixJ family response regulator
MKIKLIIADDHTVLREGLCELLEKKGDYQVIGQAADGRQLLKMLAESSPDIVIMDLAMPNLDGLAALEQLATQPSTPPILVLSANESSSNVRAALKAGAKGFIPKNAASKELEFAIDSILQGKTYLSPSITESLMTSGGIGDSEHSQLSVLSQREIEILQHLAQGKPNREIAKTLHISTRTIDTHRANILKKLNARTNADLVRIAIANNLVSV